MRVAAVRVVNFLVKLGLAGKVKAPPTRADLLCAPVGYIGHRELNFEQLLFLSFQLPAGSTPCLTVEAGYTVDG